MWPAANVGETRLCHPCYSEARRLVDRVEPWNDNIRAFGQPTLGMLEHAETERLTMKPRLTPPQQMVLVKVDCCPWPVYLTYAVEWERHRTHWHAKLDPDRLDQFGRAHLLQHEPEL